MNALWTSLGPCVYVVVLHPNGCAEERYVDMSPTKLPLYSLLGGQVTIRGQYIPEEVVVLTRREARIPSQHVLPYPFHRDQWNGPIALVRMNEHSVPESFRLKEYHSLWTKELVTRRKCYLRPEST